MSTKASFLSLLFNCPRPLLCGLQKFFSVGKTWLSKKKKEWGAGRLGNSFWFLDIVQINSISVHEQIRIETSTGPYYFFHNSCVKIRFCCEFSLFFGQFS